MVGTAGEDRDAPPSEAVTLVAPVSLGVPDRVFEEEEEDLAESSLRILSRSNNSTYALLGDDEERDGLPDAEAGAPSSGGAADAAASAPPRRGLIMPYVRLVARNREYRSIFFGNIFAELGNWFNFVATLSVLQSLSGTAMAVTYYTLVQSMPSVLLGPIIGLFVDRFDRHTIMVGTSLCRAVIIPFLILCTTEASVPYIYLLILIKSIFWAIYLPARSSIVLSLVDKEDLLLANGLDGMVWSSMIFIGAAFGGFVTSLFGVTVAFILDTMCYLLGAYCFGMLTEPGLLAPFRAAARGARDLMAACSKLRAEKAPANIELEPLAADEQDDHVDEQIDHVDDHVDNASAASLVGPSEAELLNREEKVDLPPRERMLATPSAANLLPGKEKEKEDASFGANARRLMRTYKEGLQYAWSFKYIFAICTFKASCWLTLGMIDMMNIRFAQTIFVIGENGTMSMAIMYMVIGFGTLFTPILARRLVRDTPAGTQIVMIFGLSQLVVGCTALVFVGNFYVFLAANLVRSGGTSLAQVYAALVLQKTLPAAMRGRIFALELSFMTLSSCLARVFAGYANDILGLTVYQVDTIGLAIAAVNLCWWLAFFRLSRKARDAAYAANA